jgi:hypothetical protein
VVLLIPQVAARRGIDEGGQRLRTYREYIHVRGGRAGTRKTLKLDFTGAAAEAEAEARARSSADERRRIAGRWRAMAAIEIRMGSSSAAAAAAQGSIGIGSRRRSSSLFDRCRRDGSMISIGGFPFFFSAECQTGEGKGDQERTRRDQHDKSARPLFSVYWARPSSIRPTTYFLTYVLASLNRKTCPLTLKTVGNYSFGGFVRHGIVDPAERLSQHAVGVKSLRLLGQPNPHTQAKALATNTTTTATA